MATSIDPNLTFLLVTVVLAITGLILGRNWLFTREKGTKPLQKELKYWQEYSVELEDEVKHWKGKYNKKDQPPAFDGEVTKENLPDMIGEFFPMFAEYVPKWVQPFFKQPALQKMAIDWFVKNPDKGAEMISKFFASKGGRPKSQGNTSETGTNSAQITPEIY